MSNNAENVQQEDEDPKLAYSRHKRYWLRCLNTVLPTLYTSQDSQRLTLAFFILSALDLLHVLEEIASDVRAAYIEWIYSRQRPTGGFSADDHGAGKWNEPELASTFFALASLLVLNDDFARLLDCGSWLARLQLENGSFRSSLSQNGPIVGGNDIRYCYMAAGVRQLLQLTGQKSWREVDVKALVEFVANSKVRTPYRVRAGVDQQCSHTKVLTANLRAMRLMVGSDDDHA